MYLIKSLKEKFSLILILVIILIGLFTFWPSFNLALTGDDYLTFWRYQQNFFVDHLNPLSFFLTDYGPQDSIFAFIHHFFSFNPRPYYIISFILRCFASISFYPLLKNITKNKHIPLLAVLLFQITATGLETTNWVFNMPSYISIMFLNLFILLLIEITQHFTIKKLIAMCVLLALTLITQPIRMNFLPIFIFIISLVWLIRQIYLKKSLRIPLISIFFLILTLIFIFLFTHIGNSVGISTNFKDRIRGVWIINTGGLNGLSKELERGNYPILLYPIAQIGNVIFPNSIIPFKRGDVSNSYIFTRNLIPSLIISVFLIYLSTHIFTKKTRVYFTPAIITSIFWTFIIDYIFRIKTKSPMQSFEIEAFLIGGYFLIFSCILYISASLKNKKVILISLLLLILSYIVPWIRFPHMLYETTGRYVIVSVAAFITLLITLFSISKNKLIFFILILFPLIIINIKASRLYLCKLSFERDIARTEKIRSSIPIIPTLSKKGETTLVFFQADNNEILYHAIMFGFPVITSYYQEVSDIWKVAYTQDWWEVISSYKTGEGLKRFSNIPMQPVPLNNIFSFRLDYDHLVDTTTETRNKLLAL